MRAMRSMKVFIIVFAAMVISTPSVFAKTMTFTKEYAYQASELDSKISSRTIALELVKRLLLEEIGIYLEGKTIVSNSQLAKDEIKIITAGIVKTKIISERWDGKTYRLKVEMKANPDDVEQSVQNYRERMELAQGAMDTDQRIETSLREIDKLKTKAKTAKLIEAKHDIKEEYSKQINVLNNSGIIAKAIVAHDGGHYDDAIALASQLIGKKETPWYVYFLLGSSHNQLKKFDQALSMLRQALKMSPDNPDVHIEIARTFMLKGESYNAISEAKKALARLHEDKKKLDQEKFEHIAVSDLQGRKDYVDRDIARSNMFIIASSMNIAADENARTKLAPSDDDKIKITGETRIMLDAAVKEILLLKPDLPDHLFRIDELNLVNSDFDSNKEMISWCDKLISIYPNNGQLYSIRGKYYFRLAQIDKNNYQKYAQQCFKDEEKAIELSPQNAKLYVQRSVSYSLLGKYEQGIKDLDVAIELEPNNAQAYEQRALLYGMLGINSQVIKNLDKAIELNPLKASLYYLRGSSSIETGNDAQGINDMKVAARLGNNDARELLEKMKVQW